MVDFAVPMKINIATNKTDFWVDRAAPNHRRVSKNMGGDARQNGTLFFSWTDNKNNKNVANPFAGNEVVVASARHAARGRREGLVTHNVLVEYGDRRVLLRPTISTNENNRLFVIWKNGKDRLVADLDARHAVLALLSRIRVGSRLDSYASYRGRCVCHEGHILFI